MRPVSDPVDREFLLTLWKIHILHHAGEEEGIYGHWMLEELREHGYRLSPGTLYPLIARMRSRGWLSEPRSLRQGNTRVYRLTASGQKVLARLRTSVGELHREVVEQRARKRTGRATAPRPARKTR